MLKKIISTVGFQLLFIFMRVTLHIGVIYNKDTYTKNAIK